MLIDTHCHLDWHAFAGERAEVVARAHAAGVTRMVTIGTDVPTSQTALELAAEYAGVYAVVGVHPNDCAGFDAATVEAVRGLTRAPRVVALGEIGLDYYWDKVPHEVQAQAFRAQLALAAEVGLPVVIHNREATADTLAVLGAWVAGLRAAGAPLAARPGVLHSFAGDVAEAERALALGFYLGVTGPITFKKAEQVRAVVAAVPLERLLIETDAPFLTPHPHRGQRNEPAYVRYVAEAVAKVRGLTLERVAEQTTLNAEALFRCL